MYVASSSWNSQDCCFCFKQQRLSINLQTILDFQDVYWCKMSNLTVNKTAVQLKYLLNSNRRWFSKASSLPFLYHVILRPRRVAGDAETLDEIRFVVDYQNRSDFCFIAILERNFCKEYIKRGGRHFR